MNDTDAIRNTFARYCQALDERRFEDWTRVFTPDGQFNDHIGRQAIMDYINGAALAKNPALKRKHAHLNIAINRIGEAEAESESDFLMFDKNGDGPWVLAGVGKYTDLLVRQPDGEWLIKKRIITHPIK